MSDINYLKRLFQDYYRNKTNEIPPIDSLNQREFGFIPWDDIIIMNRHISFVNYEAFKNYLSKFSPRHIYSSGALYNNPDHSDMNKKGHLGCDFLIDIDVDHFYTPCKKDHDLWYCKKCGKNGIGMVPNKCPKCENSLFKSLSWICEKCLSLAKNEIFKLIEDFLVPDFKINKEELKIVFSGHRGYHLKIENEKMRNLSSAERREIVDYLTGENISYEILGLSDLNSNLYFLEDNYGWTEKIIKKIKKIIQDYPNDVLRNILSDYGLNRDIIEYILNDKDNFLKNLWRIKGLGEKTWVNFLDNITKNLGAKIDVPVSIDIHRLIRYPGSLHGSTGFRVQELSLSELETFNPLNEYTQAIDPIVFAEKKDIKIKIEILENKVPAIKIKGKTYGPYNKGKIEIIPLHVAVFLLCKGVAKTRSFIDD
ncbi:MAG: DNA primase small subunit domain-containing protein [Candidatus Odinarchaeota archaeon]